MLCYCHYSVAITAATTTAAARTWEQYSGYDCRKAMLVNIGISCRYGSLQNPAFRECSESNKKTSNWSTRRNARREQERVLEIEGVNHDMGFGLPLGLEDWFRSSGKEGGPQKNHQTTISRLERGCRCKLRFPNGQMGVLEDTARACSRNPNRSSKLSVAGSWISNL